MKKKYKIINGIAITCATIYNEVIVNKGKKYDLTREFRNKLDCNGRIDNKVLDDIFSAIYHFYNKKQILQNEINDIKKLLIANPIIPSNFKKLLNNIFCCGRKSNYARKQEIFMENIKHLYKLATEEKTNNRSSCLSEIQTYEDEQNFIGSLKQGLLYDILRRSLLDDNDNNLLAELDNDEQEAQLTDDEKYAQLIKQDLIGRKNSQFI